MPYLFRGWELHPFPLFRIVITPPRALPIVSVARSRQPRPKPTTHHPIFAHVPPDGPADTRIGN